jgi:cytochrome c oxidase subunit 1
MGGLNYVTTILQARARGMTMMRLPLSLWGIFMATVLGLLAFPALFVSAVMMTLDMAIGTSFFMPAITSMGEKLDYTGGSPILFQHLFWFFGHPEVYIVALPAFGLVSDLLSTHARKNIFGYRMMVWAILAIGGLSFIVWAHHMYVSGMNPYFGFFFATTTEGDIHFTLPMLFAIAFIFTFTHGGLTGLFLGNVVVDLPLSDTYFVVGHFHMVMGVSPILVVFGSIYHWYPKMTGRMLNVTLGKWHFWGTVLGTYAVYLPIVAAFQLIFLYNLIYSLRNGEKSGPNPWKATTLEWQTPDNPPKHGNWGHTLPEVHRWAYDYSVPGYPDDFIPQNVPADAVPPNRDHGTEA